MGVKSDRGPRSGKQPVTDNAAERANHLEHPVNGELPPGEWRAGRQRSRKPKFGQLYKIWA